jgi:hypothetical protein
MFFLHQLFTARAKQLYENDYEIQWFYRTRRLWSQRSSITEARQVSY